MWLCGTLNVPGLAETLANQDLHLILRAVLLRGRASFAPELALMRPQGIFVEERGEEIEQINVGCGKRDPMG